MQRRQATLVTQVTLWVLVALILVLLWLLSPFVIGAIFDDVPAILSRRADIGDSFGAVSALFSALTLFGLILTLAIQRRVLTEQHEELRHQSQELVASRREQQKAAEASIRALHIELLKLSIQDPSLAAVWPGADHEPPDRQRQLQFANLIVSHQEMLHELGVLPEERVRAVFDYLFGSPLIRELWLKSREVRAKTAVQGTPSRQFFEMVDSVYREHRTADDDG